MFVSTCRPLHGQRTSRRGPAAGTRCRTPWGLTQMSKLPFVCGYLLSACLQSLPDGQQPSIAIDLFIHELLNQLARRALVFDKRRGLKNRVAVRLRTDVDLRITTGHSKRICPCYTVRCSTPKESSSTRVQLKGE